MIAGRDLAVFVPVVFPDRIYVAELAPGAPKLKKILFLQI